MNKPVYFTHQLKLLLKWMYNILIWKHSFCTPDFISVSSTLSSKLSVAFLQFHKCKLHVKMKNKSINQKLSSNYLLRPTTISDTYLELVLLISDYPQISERSFSPLQTTEKPPNPQENWHIFNPYYKNFPSIFPTRVKKQRKSACTLL